MKVYKYVCCGLIGAWVLATACSSVESERVLLPYWNTVRVRFLDDPGSLNPITARGVSSEEVYTMLFESLLGRDPATLELIPVLADSLPKVEYVKTDSGVFILFHYRIRDEARWDDGKPITGYDVEFSLKVIKNPYVDCEFLRPYYEMIIDVRVDSQDPKRVTLVADRPYMNLLTISGDFMILPEHIYDPEGLMRKVTVYQLTKQVDEVRDMPELVKFAEKWNAIVNDPADFYGSGPYKIEKVLPEQRIILVRKDNWWADQLPEEKKNAAHYAFPKRLIFEVVPDEVAVLAGLRRFRIDLTRFTNFPLFERLRHDNKFVLHYRFLDTTYLAYSYIGLNMKNPKLSDRRVREALAHLVNKDKIIEKILMGYGEPVIGPVHPSHGKYYNDTLRPYEYDPDKARKLLAEAGWQDTDGDGILDKVVDGERIPLKLSLMINSGNETRRAIALMLQEEARKVGIEIEVESVDWSIYLERLKNRDFEMNIGGWVMPVVPSDPKQIWHTEAYRGGGDNFVGFGNDTTDMIIEKLRTSMDPDTQAYYWRLLQVYIHRDIPYIFLYAPRNLQIVHRRFDMNMTLIRPGYVLPLFRVLPPEKVYPQS